MTTPSTTTNLVHVNQKNFKTEVVDAKTPVIIDFWAVWCGPCRMMGPVFEDLSKEYAGKLKFAKLDTEEEPDLAQHYGITGIPCLIIMKKGEEIERIIGFSPKPQLKMKIDNILSGMK
jgi:thioredoxin 1